jgi:two-component system chemotaxis response regulator CheY
MAHILVAEDTDSIRDLLTYFLEAAGHTVVGAADGHQALDQARRQAVDLFIYDLYMPGMAGADVIREFYRTFPGVPVIAAAGGDLTFPGVEWADRLLPRPFARDTLLSLVRELLGGALISDPIQA